MFSAVMETAAGQFPSDAKGWELLDNNPDNSITSSGVAPEIRINMGETGYPGRDFAGVWFPDGVPASGTLDVKGGTVSDYSSPTILVAITLSAIGSGKPMAVRSFSFGLDVNRQYYQFVFASLPSTTAFGLAFVGKKREIEAQWNWGAVSTQREVNVSATTPSGRVLSRNMVSVGQRIISRRWEFIDATDALAIRNAFADARGSHVPFIITDGTDDPEDGYLVRFADDQLDEVEVANGLWNVQINLIEVPYITPGEVF